MSRKSENEGLSLAYRIGYRIRYAALHLFGPATLGEGDDPHARMRRQRARRMDAARARREAGGGKGASS